MKCKKMKHNNKIFLLFVITILTLFFVYTNSNKHRSYYKSSNDEPLNVYNQPLEQCPDSVSESQGSWMQDKTCTEPGGGVHQICFKNIGTNANKFSKRTGQSDWSTERGDQNHCVCLGAWSLYEAKKNKGIFNDTNTSKLKCSAIPKTVFSEKYVKNFGTWNGHELPNQIEDGLDGILRECIQDANGDQTKINNLKSNYNDFKSNIGL